MEVVRNGQILGYILKDGWLDWMGKRVSEKQGRVKDNCKVWFEMGKFIGRVGLVGRIKILVLDVLGFRYTVVLIGSGRQVVEY